MTKKGFYTLLLLLLFAGNAAAQEQEVPIGEYFRFEISASVENQTFVIPLFGYVGGNYTSKTYNWNIDWGDDSAIETKTGTQNADGVPHTYTEAGTYVITITPAGSNEAWFTAFGFAPSTYSMVNPENIANSQANKDMVTKVISPLTPLMTRSDVQISGDELPPTNEWAYTFSGCTNLTMGNDFTFSESWNSITTVGNHFAGRMFENCSGDTFTMNSVFNLPQSITEVGGGFAHSMFFDCSGAAFKMNSIFNLPQGITTVSNLFAYAMFANCSGTSFTMNEVFNLPQNITAVGESFAGGMFIRCSGDAFTMNEVFNLPQGITEVDKSFADGMFANCSGASFTMNEVFNLPQNIIKEKGHFAYRMFQNCSGASFTMNEVFNLPQDITGTIGERFADMMFEYCSGASFTMNEVFNLPQGITKADRNFAQQMFYHCSGASFTMNEVFNLPQNITAVGDYFAAAMFANCSGASFTMNEVFNIPMGITKVEDYFVSTMFSGCSGSAFTMNYVFNLPQNITEVYRNFASTMFQGCSGEAFVINDEFEFPLLTQSEIDKDYVFHHTFYAVSTQSRTAASIINGNSIPGINRDTFRNGYSSNNKFPDLANIHTNWGGSGGSTPIISQVAVGKVFAQIKGNIITLQNLPSNSKVEVYNLKGNRINSGNAGNLPTLDIGVQTKGVYIIKTTLGSKMQKMRVVVR